MDELLNAFLNAFLISFNNNSIFLVKTCDSQNINSHLFIICIMIPIPEEKLVFYDIGSVHITQFCVYIYISVKKILLQHD